MDSNTTMCNKLSCVYELTTCVLYFVWNAFFVAGFAHLHYY